MRDEDEIAPGHRLVLQRGARSMGGVEPLRNPRGVVDSALTGWQADRKAKANRKLAEFERAQADYIRARGDVATAMVHTARSIAELNELPLILENDAEVRAAEREQRLAEAQRSTLNAQHGREATETFKVLNFDIGEARKKAQRAEYVDLTPAEPRASETSEETVLERLEKATRAALDLKNQKLADGEDAVDLEARLQTALAALRDAGIEI